MRSLHAGKIKVKRSRGESLPSPPTWRWAKPVVGSVSQGESSEDYERQGRCLWNSSVMLLTLFTAFFNSLISSLSEQEVRALISACSPFLMLIF